MAPKLSREICPAYWRSAVSGNHHRLRTLSRSIGMPREAYNSDPRPSPCGRRQNTQLRMPRQRPSAWLPMDSVLATAMTAKDVSDGPGDDDIDQPAHHQP